MKFHQKGLNLDVNFGGLSAPRATFTVCFPGTALVGPPKEGRKEIILRSNSPWGFHPFQPPNSPKGQVARVFGELPPCMTRGSSLRPLGCLT